MTTYILIFDGFAQFEIIFTSLFMKKKSEIVIVGIDSSEVTSLEGFIVKPTLQLKDVDCDAVDLFVIPGGDAKNIYDNEQLNEVLRRLNDQKKVIAAICAAPVKLAKAGILNNKRFTVDHPELLAFSANFENSIYVDENVVIDDHIITAKPCGYMDFALDIGKKMGIFENETEIQETVDFFKYGNCNNK